VPRARRTGTMPGTEICASPWLQAEAPPTWPAGCTSGGPWQSRRRSAAQRVSRRSRLAARCGVRDERIGRHRGRQRARSRGPWSALGRDAARKSGASAGRRHTSPLTGGSLVRGALAVGYTASPSTRGLRTAACSTAQTGRTDLTVEPVAPRAWLGDPAAVRAEPAARESGTTRALARGALTLPRRRLDARSPAETSVAGTMPRQLELAAAQRLGIQQSHQRVGHHGVTVREAAPAIHRHRRGVHMAMASLTHGPSETKRRRAAVVRQDVHPRAAAATLGESVIVPCLSPARRPVMSVPGSLKGSGAAEDRACRRLPRARF
jgi:hypothetical protein